VIIVIYAIALCRVGSEFLVGKESHAVVAFTVVLMLLLLLVI